MKSLPYSDKIEWFDKCLLQMYVLIRAKRGIFSSEEYLQNVKDKIYL